MKPKMITMEMMQATAPKGTKMSFDQFPVAETTESDSEIIERLRYRFQVLDGMTRAVKKGDVRAMIVSGPPGVGKSFGVEAVLSKHDVFADVAQDNKIKKYEIVKGAMSAIGLYKKLYEYSDRRSEGHV